MESWQHRSQLEVAFCGIYSFNFNRAKLLSGENEKNELSITQAASNLTPFNQLLLYGMKLYTYDSKGM